MRGIEQYLQVDAATLGALKYAGTWNASTNTPTLASGVGTQGQYYVVSVAGSTNLDGETNWQVGDWAVFNGSVWQKVDGGSTGLLSTLTVTGNTYLATTSGNVGIGTTSPASQFNMYNATNATATIQGDAIVTLAIERYSTNSIAPSFAIRKFRGTLAAPTAVATGDVIANLNFVAYGGTTQRVVSQVRSFVDTYVSDTDISSYLTFSTSPAGSAAATEQMRITSAGNVGIGTSSPGYRLDVYKAGAASISAARSDTQAVLRSEVGACAADLNVISTYGEVRTATNHPLLFSTNATERMRIDTSGNVGIGTSSPVANLDVRGASGGILGQFLENSSGSNRRIRFSISSNVSNIESIASTGSTNLAFAVDGTERMRIDASGNVGIGAIPTGYGKLEVYQSANNRILFSGASAYGNNAIAGINDVGAEVSMGIAGSPVAFYTNATERMRIDSAGNLGIGTSSPSYKLDVAASAARIRSTSAYSGLLLSSGDPNASTRNWLVASNWNAYGDFALVQSNAQGGDPVSAGTTRLTVDASGNVGIGTTSPAAKLDVVGSLGIRVNEDAAGTKVIQIRSNFAGLGPSIQVSTADPLLFLTSNTERMRITSTGDVGIGTSSPGTRLDVAGTFRTYQSVAAGYASSVFENSNATGYVQHIFNVGSSGASGQAAIGYAPGIFFAVGPTANDTTTPIVFRNNNATERMRIDASGNLGLGVTPSAWAGYKPLQAGTGASFGGYAGDVLSFVGSNTYNDNTNWRYIVSGNAAARYQQSAGIHAWYTAPSGTAGNAISFTQTMTLDASGQLGIGTSGPSYKLDVAAAGTVTARVQNTTTSADACFQAQNTVATGLFGVNATGQYMYTAQSVPTLFYNAGSERMRITSAGNIHTPAGATTMTNGFFYIPAAAGVPTGVPTAITGTVPMYYDTTNNKFYVYNGAWKSVTLT